MIGTLIGIAVVAGFLGLAGLVAIIFAIIYGIRHAGFALKGKPYQPLLGSGEAEYSHQDVDAGADSASLHAIFKRYQHTDGVAQYARSGLTSLDSVERKTASFTAVLDSKFQPGSITWQKFGSAVSTAKEAVLRNCATLANAVQLFDHADYRQLTTIKRRSKFRSDIQLNATQIEKLDLLERKLTEMGNIITANDKILLELDRLSTEIDKLDDAGNSAESERLINEIRTLTDETKYYKQRLDDMG